MTKRLTLTVLSVFLGAALTLSTVITGSANAAVSGLHGIDVNSTTRPVNWTNVARHTSFAYTKATEGTYYVNPRFTGQYNGPYRNRTIRGAYHFAIPNNSRGAVQANFFVRHGGGWSRDGRTLPGAVDLEPNPYGRICYRMTKKRMVAWIWDFVNTYRRDTGVYPVIYTSSTWWRACTGNARGFARFDPLWIACYCKAPGSVTGFPFYTFWQYSQHGSLPGDQDVFNGSRARLRALANG